MQVLAPIAKLVYNLGAYIALPIFMHNTRRCRVVIMNRTNSKVLLVRTLISEQKWSLVGGGIKRGEKAVAGAIREVAEETSLQISQKDLSFLKEQKLHTKNVSYVGIYYIARLKNPQPLKKTPEILEMKWFKLNNLPDNIVPATRRILQELQG